MITEKEAAALGLGKKRCKYGNHRVVVDGITFDSKKEANRYGELIQLQKAGKIWMLQVHPRYALVVNGEKVCSYCADFRYICKYFGPVVEDVKSPATRKNRAYRIKVKLLKACHGIKVVEI